MTKEEQVVALLKSKNLRISFAESCTAGLAAARLVNVPGTSDVFEASFVTYANRAKEEFLGVLPQTLAAHGAVSEEVAREMAKGCAEKAGADVGVGISGIAGPDGGSAEKPVGTVCFGFYSKKGLQSTTAHFGNIGRESVRHAAVELVFDRLLTLLGES